MPTPEQFQQLIAGGVFGVLALVIAYLLFANWRDRQQHLTSIDAANKRANEAEQRADAAESRERIAQQRLDEEREARRRAEDQHAQDKRAADDQHAELMREVRGLKSTVARLEAELARVVQTAGGA